MGFAELKLKKRVEKRFVGFAKRAAGTRGSESLDHAHSP
jgi:hypothetical protein